MSSFDCVSRAKRTAVWLAWMWAPAAFGQVVTPASQSPPASGRAERAIAVPTAAAAHRPEQLPSRIFGIIPNYRSNASFADAKPLTAKEKFRLAARDSFDPGTFVLAGAIAGIGLATDSTPTYGGGMAGYGQYYGASYGDLMIGNMMTGAVYPSLLHQDPRYFRRGTGSAWSRLGYAVSQIFLTHGDNRRKQFNYSEFAGNATAVAISNAYNPDNRNAADAGARLGIQIGLDMAGNILKEFGPDVQRRLFGHKHASTAGVR